MEYFPLSGLNEIFSTLRAVKSIRNLYNVKTIMRQFDDVTVTRLIKIVKRKNEL
jgi:hypothetical protein